MIVARGESNAKPTQAGSVPLDSTLVSLRPPVRALANLTVSWCLVLPQDGCDFLIDTSSFKGGREFAVLITIAKVTISKSKDTRKDSIVKSLFKQFVFTVKWLLKSYQSEERIRNNVDWWLWMHRCASSPLIFWSFLLILAVNYAKVCRILDFFAWVLNFFVHELFWRGRKKACNKEKGLLSQIKCMVMPTHGKCKW